MNGYIFANFFGGYAKARKSAGFSSLALNSYDIYYIANQTLRNKTAAKELLSKLLQVVSVAGVSEDEIRNALGLTWRDFEDSVQYSVALLQEMDGIVTRNEDDYAESEVEVWRPEELLSFIQK